MSENKLPEIEIYHFEMPRPQAFLPNDNSTPRIGGTRGEVKVRLADDHGVWDAGDDIRAALKALMRTCKSFALPYHIDNYRVVFTDTTRCRVFDAEGKELTPVQSILCG